MYNNIITDENQVKAFVPDKIKTKLKMLFSITAMTVAAIATFSGCNSVKQEVSHYEPTQDTSYVQELKEEKNTSKYEINKEVAEEEETTENNLQSQVMQS